MNKLQLIYSLTKYEACALYNAHGSITKALRHLGIKNDPRCRKCFSEKLDNQRISEKHKPKASDEQILNLASTSSSITELLKTVGLQPVGANFTRVRRVLTEHNIELLPKKPPQMWPDELVYVENSKFPRNYLAKRVKRDKWLLYQCECGNTGVWRDKPMNLHLDHIDGVNTNHTKSNLRWICPNCHSQTDTFGGRNNKK